MADLSRPTRGRKRFPFSNDRNYAIYLRLSLVSPMLPLLLLVFLEQPVNQRIRVALLVVSSLMLIGAAFFHFRFLSKVLSKLASAVHELEQYYKVDDDDFPTASMLDSLVRLEQHVRSLGEQQQQQEILQKQANLNAFQSQINPHFLYNMLDTIRGQALEDGSIVTSDMIESLSRMMRYAISNNDSMVTLGVEFKNIDNYIKIQQFRFGNRFNYVKCLSEIDDSLISQKIPKLTLQPIVENAIFHGIESMVSGGEIKLMGFNTQSRLVIQISDNGNGMDEIQLDKVRRKLQNSDTVVDGSVEKGTGIALANVNARLKLVFGSEYGISIFSTQNVGTMVEITIPINDGNR